MDCYLNLVRLPLNDSDAVGPKGFQAMLLGPGNNEQVTLLFQVAILHLSASIPIECVLACAPTSSTTKLPSCQRKSNTPLRLGSCMGPQIISEALTSQLFNSVHPAHCV